MTSIFSLFNNNNNNDNRFILHLSSYDDEGRCMSYRTCFRDLQDVCYHIWHGVQDMVYDVHKIYNVMEMWPSTKQLEETFFLKISKHCGYLLTCH